jgi:hypothetical protein
MFELVKNGIEAKKVPKRLTAIAACLAALAICVIMYQIPGVSSFAGHTINEWISTLSGKTLTADKDSVYVSLNNTGRSRIEAKYNSIDEIEEMLGVDILQSGEAYEGTEGLIMYYPVIMDGKLSSAVIRTPIYSLGDLKDVKVTNDAKDITASPSAEYSKGELYSSTMYMSVTISGRNGDPEAILGYIEGDQPIDPAKGVTEHKLLQVDATAELQSYKAADGLGSVELEWGESFSPLMTVAYFVYEGKAYSYMARVSQAAMMNFLDSLSAEPDKYKVSKPSGNITIDNSDDGAIQIARAESNADGEMILVGGKTYTVGEGDLAPGRYDIEVVGKIRDDGAYLMEVPGQKILGKLYFDNNQAGPDEGTTWIIKPAAMTPLKKVGDTYILTNTYGHFKVGEQIEAGVYEVKLEADEKLSGEKEPRGLLLQLEAEDGDNFYPKAYEPTLPQHQQLDNELGYGPKPIELAEGAYLHIANFGLNHDFTLTLKKMS